MRQGEQGEVRGVDREYTTANRTADRVLCKDGRGKKDRGTQRDGRGETERRIEKYNVTEEGRRRDEQGATKERKGAEFLKDLHLRAGFGIMER